MIFPKSSQDKYLTLLSKGCQPAPTSGRVFWVWCSTINNTHFVVRTWGRRKIRKKETHSEEMCAYYKPHKKSIMQVSFTTHGYFAERIQKGNLFEDDLSSKCHEHGLRVNQQILFGSLVFSKHPSDLFCKIKIKYMQPFITLTLDASNVRGRIPFETPHGDLQKQQKHLGFPMIFL